MSEKTAKREVTVTNAQGLHARPAHALVTLAAQFQSQVEILKDGERVDGKSILSILTLAAVRGTHLELRATGDDAEAAVAALADLISRGFDEHEQEAAGLNGSSDDPRPLTGEAQPGRGPSQNGEAHPGSTPSAPEASRVEAQFRDADRRRGLAGG